MKLEDGEAEPRMHNDFLYQHLWLVKRSADDQSETLSHMAVSKPLTKDEREEHAADWQLREESV